MAQRVDERHRIANPGIGRLLQGIESLSQFLMGGEILELQSVVRKTKAVAFSAAMMTKPSSQDPVILLEARYPAARAAANSAVLAGA